MHAVVDGHDHFGRGEKRRLMVRYMNHIQPLPVQIDWDRDVVSPKPVFFWLVELLKIRRQRSEFVKVALRPDQEVIIKFIDSGKVPHKVPNVGAHSEFIDFADVDRDAHD